MKRTCVQCGKEFEITDSEAAFFKSKNLQLPKRCKECRAENKGQNSKPAGNSNRKNEKKTYGSAEASNSGASAKKGRKPNKGLLIIAAVIVAAIVLGISFFGNGNTPEPLQLDTDYNPQNEITQQLPAEPETAAPETTEKNDNPYADAPVITQNAAKSYRFRNQKLLNQHYEKHGKEMGFNSAAAYEAAASAVINNPNAMHKTEKEDGDYVYYVKSSNEFVILSTDGYIRTYFNPSGGLDYYNRQ